MREYQICNRCVMDTTDPLIVFDENGYCNHCTNALALLRKVSFANETERINKLNQVVTSIKKSSKGKKYDCIIGLSGGVDSSYLAYVVVKQLGLNPLAVHVDNGWNTELAIQNIENIVKKLEIDLYTYVLDWDEFKDLQKAYLKASVIDLEVLSDNAIVVVIHRLMKKYGIKYFLIGHNYQSESIMPTSWLYSPKYDGLNIRSIYRRFGSGLKLKTYPTFNLIEYIKYRFFNNSIPVNILDLIHYNKSDAIETLKKEFDWRDYGGKHYESKITQIYQAYILPKKFNVDKRKAHLSSLIISNQITREQAIESLNESIYDKFKLENDINFFCKKLEFSIDEFNLILKSKPVSHYSYPSYNLFFEKLLNFRNVFKK